MVRPLDGLEIDTFLNHLVQGAHCSQAVNVECALLDASVEWGIRHGVWVWV